MSSAADKMTTEFVAAHGASLWTASFGAGVPLVLAHGGPGLSNNLQPVGEMVEDVARVHLYDQRGGGRSSADGPFDVETFVVDLEALRAHWGHERWMVGGHSWGAALAPFYALAHPERTLGVIYLAGTAIHWGFQDGVRAERMSRLAPEEREELERLGELLRERGAKADQDRVLRLMWSTDFATREAASVLGPDPDPVGARDVAEVAPFGEWAPLAAAGHSPWLEQPAAMRERLRAFTTYAP